MRIIILSIAFILCAFTAQSQVLKSAGVWYFLDVDSMTARPAVLPNGTELAYVIGTKTVYYWNRNTSTWTAYGSTFNRDSIYFDSSIVGSGTVSDPWGVDSTLFATIAWVGDSLAAALLNYLPIEGGTLTGTGGAGFVGFPSQVTAPGTPASGLNVYAQGSSFNWKGTDGYERQITSTLTGGHSYDLPNVNGTFALGTGTTDRSARWSATNTLAAGNFTDNGTKVQALLPFQFQSWTTAGRPTGVSGYFGDNSSLDWFERYSTTAGSWISPLQSSFSGGRGTARYVLFNDSNGRATESADFQFNSTSRTLDVVLNTTDNARGINVTQIGGGIIAGAIRFRKSGGGTFVSPAAAANGNLIGAFSFQGHDGTSYPLDLAFFGAKITGAVSTGTVPTSIFFNAGQNVNQYNSDLLIYHTGSVGIGRTGNGSVASTMTSPARLLTVYGEARIADLTTDTPTRIVGADSDGDLADITWLVPLSTSSLGIGVTPTENLDVNGDVRVRDSLRVSTASSILQTDASGWVKPLTIGSGLSFLGGTLSSTATDTHFANTNLTATGNRTHDWANYNFTWINMKKFMWGADSLFKITKEYSGYTYAVMRAPSGQALLDLQGNAGSASNSAELRLTDNTSGRIVFINHDRRGFGSNGYRMEHYNGSNYHNMLFVDETSRLFHVNQGGYSSGTFQDGDAAIMTNLLKNISRDGTGTFNTDTIMAVHYFRAKNNLTKNRDVFGIYGQDGAIDTMYTRFDKTGRLFQYKDAFFTRNVSFTRYGQNAKSATALSKTLTNQNAAFATDGTILEVERKRDTTIYVTDSDYNFSSAITSAQVLSRYNRIFIYSKLTASATSDNQIILPSASSDFLQCTIYVYSNDASADADATSVDFTTNGATDGAGGTVTSDSLVGGQTFQIRPVNDGGYLWAYF